LRAYFQAQGLSQKSLDTAVSQFSREALEHALRALQNAAALKRLSAISLSPELRYVDLVSKQQWTEMAAQHAAALESELRALHEHLSVLSSSPDQRAGFEVPRSEIENPAQFARTVDQLLCTTKVLDQRVSSVFASSQTTDAQLADIQSQITTISDAIPLQKAVEVTSFAVQLNASGKTSAMNPQDSRSKAQPFGRP